MVEKIYFILIGSFILLTIIFMITDKMKINKRKSEVILQLRKGINIELIFGLIYFICFVVFSYLLVDGARDVYYTLGRKYINNVYQLFDLRYLTTLNKYFSENIMLIELNRLAYYQSMLLSILVWIIFTCCSSLLKFYKAGQPNEILKNGIVVSGNFIKYDRIASYRKSDLHEKKWMSKNIKYYDYFIELKSKNILWIKDIKNEVKLHVSCGTEDLVNSSLESLIKKSLDF